jgi:hypothetical protein
MVLAFFGLLAIAWELAAINDTLKGIREAQETLAEPDNDV